MTIEQKFIDQFTNITSNAAVASYNFVGKKDKIAADKAAVDSMRNDLNKVNIKGKIVIGEGELDKAPMLHIGEKVGTTNGPEIDIAVDPLEGTNFVANNLPGALSSSPSPITILPLMFTLFKSFLIESTAALSAAILSFFPTKLYEATAAFDVIFVN
jgi:hypothetical protein